MLEVAARKQIGQFKLDVEFRVPTPGVVALFGRSGCGKTTLIRILAGLTNADGGRASIEGRLLFDVACGFSRRAERRRIGYVFQDSRLFPHLDVDANLRYAERRAGPERFVSREQVLQLLDLGGLLMRRTQQLSGGERQRVAIGRALLAQPQLLLLDEPLASLDNARREEVLPYLEQLRDRMAIPVIYVSHQFEEVLRLATHFVVMRDGGVAAAGDLDAVSRDPHLRQIVGADALGTVLDAAVIGTDAVNGLTRLRLGNGELHVEPPDARLGPDLRVQILARDVMLALEEPVSLSVRNRIAGVVCTVTEDDAVTDLVTVDIGGGRLLSRVTRAASRELDLRPGKPVWALIKTAALRGHMLKRPASPGA